MNKRVSNQEFFEGRKLREMDHPPIIVGEELTSTENMGAILRLADNFGCEKVFFVNEDGGAKTHKLKKTAVTAFKKIQFEFISFEELNAKLPEDYVKIAVDTSEESEDLFLMKPEEKAVYIFGNESLGMSNKMLEICNKSVFIPLGGRTFSMNVSHAVAVILFEHLRRFGR